MKTRLVAGLFAGLLLLGACSDDSSSDADASSEESSSSDAAVSTADTDLGAVLVNADGLTLYGFTPDADAGGTPTCEGGCADAWPPVIVDGDALPEGLDAAVFTVVERPDGDFQLAAGGNPLYAFSGDAAAGDVNGQGSADTWFVVGPDGALIGVDGASTEEADTSGGY